MSSNFIYLDYAATTPIDERVATKMINHMTFEGTFGNPASRSHGFGWQAEEAVENARMQIADVINADSREIVFTSGATESNNLALKGIAHMDGVNGKHIITSKIEHKAVLDTCQQLEKEGFEVTYLDPEPATGKINPQQIRDSLRSDTILVSLMAVNNELGTITDIAAIGEITRSAGVLFHVDAAQAIGKIKIDIQAMKIDLMSMSAHKSYGPKGIGALYVRIQPKIHLKAQIHGGGHERGMRSGTLATHQIVGMGEAFSIAIQDFDKDNAKTVKLRDYLWKGIKNIEGVCLNGSIEDGVPHIINIGFKYITESNNLIASLDKLAVSSGSACNSVNMNPSYVLSALGLSNNLAHNSIRFSFGRYTTKSDIDVTLIQIKETVKKLRKKSVNYAK